MDEARALARSGAPDGTVIVADAMTAGRGAHGHGWHAPAGGLYLSLVIRGLEDARLLTLALGCAAYLRWVRSRLAHPAGDDLDLPLIERHWRAVDPDAAPGPVLATALERLAARALADAGLWGANLTELPGLLEATTRWLLALERDGVDAALEALHGMPDYAATGRT